MELIDKSALVAEIEKLYKKNTDRCSIEGIAAAAQLRMVLDFLNTLEVKEVEKPIEIGFECIPVMASTEIGKSEYQIRANVTEYTLQQILKTKIIKML